MTAVTNETYDWESIYGRLREEADREFPPYWNPAATNSVGEELVGVIVQIQEAVPTKHGHSPVVTIRRPDDEYVALWLNHTALRREFERAGPLPGETVLVRYQGRVEPDGGGMAYEKYRLVVDRKAAPANWGRIAERYGDQVDFDDQPERQEPVPDVPADVEDIPF